jgi:hypothetical protein
MSFCGRYMTPRCPWRPWWFDRVRYIGPLRLPPGVREVS